MMAGKIAEGRAADSKIAASKTCSSYVPSEKSPLPAELWPDIDHIVTEDESPIYNLYSEKQQRLLTEPLYSSWDGPSKDRPFLACANVGLFYAVNENSLVPDALLSVDVRPPDDLWPKYHRSYFIWWYAKAPEVVIEVVSNMEGEEHVRKLKLYAQVGVPYYVIWDPQELLSNERLRCFFLQGRRYQSMKKPWFAEVNLGLKVWSGKFEDVDNDWLRWCDARGAIILSGKESAAREKERARREKQRADKLAAQLRALGAEPKNGK